MGKRKYGMVREEEDEQNLDRYHTGNEWRRERGVFGGVISRAVRRRNELHSRR